MSYGAGGSVAREAVAMVSTAAPREALHQHLQDRIKRLIIERGARPGDPLPPEAELMAALGVGRGSLREAIKALQTLGVVETRHGFGTFVGRFSLDPLVDGLTFRIRIDPEHAVRAVRDLLELREVIETALVARVAHDPTPEHLAQLAALVARMDERTDRGERSSDADRAFHEALYRPLGNALVIQLLQAFWDVFFLVRDEIPSEPPDPTLTARLHRPIVDAIANRDPTAASAAMALHFGDIQRRIGDATPPSPAPRAAPMETPPATTDRSDPDSAAKGGLRAVD